MIPYNRKPGRLKLIAERRQSIRVRKAAREYWAAHPDKWGKINTDPKAWAWKLAEGASLANPLGRYIREQVG